MQGEEDIAIEIHRGPEREVETPGAAEKVRHQASLFITGSQHRLQSLWVETVTQSDTEILVVSGATSSHRGTRVGMGSRLGDRLGWGGEHGSEDAPSLQPAPREGVHTCVRRQG